MIKKVLFVCFIALFANSAFSQGKIVLKEGKLSDFYPQSIGKSFAKGYLFKVGDGEFELVGYKAKNLEEVLKTNEAAYKEFKKFKRKVTISKVAYYVGIAGLVAYPLVLDENDTEEQFIRKSLATVGTSLVASTTTLILMINSSKHLHNAVVIYNQSLE